jgi:hypothetical protein
MLQIGSTAQRGTPTCAGVGDCVQPCRWRSAHARGVRIQLGRAYVLDVLGERYRQATTEDFLGGGYLWACV